MNIIQKYEWPHVRFWARVDMGYIILTIAILAASYWGWL